MEWDLLRRDVFLIPVLVAEEDKLVFMEDFSVQKCYEVLSGNYDTCSFDKHLWKGYIPNKVSFILWACFHDSLPARDMLTHRGMIIESDLCVLCNDKKETPDHMFMHYSYSFEIWDYFIKTFKISWPMPKILFHLFEAWSTNV